MQKPISNQSTAKPQNFIKFVKLYKVFISLAVFLLSVIFASGASVSAATSSNLNVSAVIDNTLNVSIPTSLVSLNLNPNTENLAKQYIPVTVGTNNEYGYTLIMSASTTSLTRDDSEDGISATLPTLEYQSTGYTDSAFMLNRWGYNKNTAIDNGDGTTTPSNDTNWYSMNSTSVELAKNSTKTNNEVTTVGFAAKVDYDKPAGSYNLDLTFAATPNPKVYYVNYTDASGDASVTGAPLNPASTSSGTAGTGIDLSSAAPTRTGYTFSGWCTAEPTDSATTCPSPATKYSADTNFPITDTTETTTTLYATWSANSYTCQKQYRLQNVDGTFPETYTQDTSEDVAYGSTCTYNKTVSDYKGSENGTNGSAGETSGTVDTDGLTLSLDFYRNTYALTVNRNTTYISSVSGAGTYRWGQSVTISASPSSSGVFASWSQTAGTTGAFGSTTSANTTFTMPPSNATIYANGKEKPYIQDFTKTNCSSLASSSHYTVYDKRDGNSYTVRYLNGNCWMTQNLRFAGTSLDPSTSNINVAKTIQWSDLSSGYSYTNAKYHNSGNTTYGYWYNYAGASAMTIVGEGNSSESTYDICPKGWRLPTKTELSGIAGVNYLSTFRPTAGGTYLPTGTAVTERGSWWSSTAYGGDKRYVMEYNSNYGNAYGGIMNVLDGGACLRRSGQYVRCIRSS